MRTSRASRCSAFQRLSTALTGPPDNLSLVRRRAGVGPPTVGIPRAESIELVYQARYIGEVRHRDARSPEAVEVEIHYEEASSGARVGVGCHQVVE